MVQLNKLKTLLLTVFIAGFIGVASANAVSVSDVEYQSNGQFFDGSLISIYFIASQDTESINVPIRKSQLEQSISGDVQQELSLEATSQDSYAKYTITDSEKRSIVDLQPITSNPVDTINDMTRWASNNCYDVNNDGTINDLDYNANKVLSWDLTDFKIFCVSNNGKIGEIGRIGSSDQIFTTTWKLKASGKTVQTATLSNGAAGSGTRTSLGENVKISWQGSMSTGEDPPEPTDELALYTGTELRIVTRTDYQAWNSYLKHDLPERIDSWADNGYPTKQELANTIEEKRKEASSSISSGPWSGTEVVKASADNGVVTIDMSDSIAWPSFTVYIDACKTKSSTGCADYVSITKPVGEPQIVSTSSQKIPELGTGYVTATVKNVGDGSGSFTARLMGCSDSFRFADTQTTKTVKPGETVTYRFAASFSSGSSQKKITGSCSFEVSSSVGRALTQISVTGVSQNECQPGNRLSQVNSTGQVVIYKCKDGMQLQKVEGCTGDEVAGMKDGKLSCVSKSSRGDITGPSSGSGLFAGLTGLLGLNAVPSPFGGTLQKLQTGMLLVDILVSLLAALAGFKFASRSIGSVFNDKLIKAGVAVVVAGLAGFATYLLISTWVIKIVALVVAGGYLYLEGLAPDIEMGL